MFIVRHLSEVKIAIETCLAVISGYQSVGMFLCIGINSKKVKELHRLIQGIVDEGSL